MKFKIGDKVTILLSSLPEYKKVFLGKATSGVIIKDCPVPDCMIVKLNTGVLQHLFMYHLTPTIKKNQQLEFPFMEEK